MITVLQMRVLAGSVVVAAALVVAGCSSDEGAPPPPASVTSSAESSAPSSASPDAPVTTPDATLPALPELPAAATTADAAGAEAFVRHFWDVVNYAYATGDTDAVLAISDEGCVACQSLVDNVRSVTEDDASWIGMEWQTSDYLSDAPNAQGRSLVSGLLIANPDAYVLNDDGTRDDIDLREPGDFQIITAWSETKWSLYEVSSFANGTAH